MTNRTNSKSNTFNKEGGEKMDILEELKPKEVARDFLIGKTRVIIATDYCKPKEQVEEILKKIARDAQRALATV